MKKPEEVWEPISEWGRNIKPYLDQVKRQALIVARTPKFRKPRIYISIPPPRKVASVPKPKRITAAKLVCEKCDTFLRSDNVSGYCQKHARQLWGFQNRRKIKVAA